MVLPGWAQYCVTRAVLHCLVEDAETFSWMTRREKQWLIAYVQVAGPEPVEVAYDEAVELYEQADALDSQACIALVQQASLILAAMPLARSRVYRIWQRDRLELRREGSAQSCHSRPSKA